MPLWQHELNYQNTLQHQTREQQNKALCRIQEAACLVAPSSRQ